MALALWTGAAGAALTAATRPAPPLSFVTADGQTISLEALRGKVVVIEFGLTTCPACQESARSLSKVQTDYASQGLQVIAVMMDPEAPLKLREFANLNAKTFPVGAYGYMEARKWLQVPEVMRLLVPVIVLVDRAGNIREQHSPDEKPWAEKKDEMLKASLKALLAEKAKPAAKQAKKPAPKK
jgi:peroxiredoxin